MSKKLIIVILAIVLILTFFLKRVDLPRLKRINKLEFSVLVECPGENDQSLIINAFWVYRNFSSLIININKTDAMLAARVKDVLSVVIESEVSSFDEEDLKLEGNKAMGNANDLLEGYHIVVKYVKITKIERKKGLD